MEFLAVSGQQAVGFAIAALTVVGWLIFGIVNTKSTSQPGSEIELAPNRKPYLDDEGLEGPKLDRALGWGLATLAFVALGLPIYWLAEPGRQDGAEAGFQKREVSRGAHLFEEFCASCHGTGGAGEIDFTITTDPDDPTSIKQVKWAVPPVNEDGLRFDNPRPTPLEYPELTSILVYGRPGTPMPAWGVAGGGPMNSQQIADLVAYLTTPVSRGGLMLEADPVKEENAKLGTDGQALFEAFCARCHTKGWSYRDSYPETDAEPGGGGGIAPNLRDGATLRQFLTAELHAEFVRTGSEPNKPYGVRGIGGAESGGMPGFGQILSDEQIEAIVEYERSL